MTEKQERKVRKALYEIRWRIKCLEESLRRPLKLCHRERVEIRLKTWRSAERLLAKAWE